MIFWAFFYDSDDRLLYFLFRWSVSLPWPLNMQIYLMDIHIWYTLLSAIYGAVMGARARLGEVQFWLCANSGGIHICLMSVPCADSFSWNGSQAIWKFSRSICGENGISTNQKVKLAITSVIENAKLVNILFMTF